MKKLLIAVSALTSALALNAVEFSSLSFSTVGPDKYADGSVVMDGECYALVASVGGFDGFNFDGTIADSNDSLLIALPLAKDGKCSPIVFNIDSTLIAGKEVGLYLLDTRKFIEGKPQVQGLTDGKLTFVNASEKINTEVSVAQAGSGAAPQAGAADEAVSGTGASSSILPPDIPQPVITKIEFQGDYVVLTADKTFEGANYQAVGGKTPGSSDVLGEAKLGGGDGVTFAFPKNGNDAAFIKLIRK